MYSEAGKYLVSAIALHRVIASVSLTITPGAATAVDAPTWAVDMLDQVNAARARVGAKPVVLCVPAMAAWINSPGHYANIIAKDSTHLGVGHRTNPNSTYGDYWVQNFGAGGNC